MFTGIIEGFGTITGIQASGPGKHITVESDFDLERTKIGDSIAVSGACLTAVLLDGRKFQVDVAPETLERTNLGKAKTGDRVNLERALMMTGRLDGHLVSGHIDGRGTIKSKEVQGNAVIVTVNISEALSRYMIEKGSVAVDGISLTINSCSRESFEVSIIPHTAKLTTIGFKKPGDNVNIETDMIGKYVEKLLSQNRGEKESNGSSIDMKLLAEKGFL